ncbi:MAG: AMP-binding protein [Burkholderiaceae bacterium]
MSEFYDALETRDPAQREADLLGQLPGFVQHAVTHAPGWARHLSGFDPSAINSRAELAKLPVLRKSDLIGLQEKTPPFGGLNTIAPGEMTALFMSPGPVLEPEAPQDDPFRAARALHAAGIRKGHILQNCFGYHMTPGAWMVHNAARKIGCAVIPAGIGQTEQQLDLIRMYNPNAYVGTPSFLRILIERAKEMGSDISNLKQALVGAEALPPSLRQWFLDQGMDRVLQWYGTAEVGLIGYETPALDGMVIDEGVVLEIVRPGTSEPVPEGEVGEVVVTTFTRAYPMIRLGTGDLSAVLPGASPCGRTNMRIKGWMGRADQATKVRGMFVKPDQVAAIVKRFDEISKARLVITGELANDEMCLHCETTVNDEAITARVIEAIRDVTKLRGDVRLVAPGSLPNDGLVIQDLRKYD